MDVFQNRYYRLTRFLLLITGQWPYDISKWKLIPSVIIFLTFASCLDVQVTKIIMSEKDLDLFVDTVGPLIVCTLCCTKYITFLVNKHLIIKLLERIRYDWSRLTIKNEVKIIREHTENGRFIGACYIFFNYGGLLVFVFVELLPLILDMLAPADEPRSCFLPFQGEYFVDQEKYLVPILLHMLCVVVVAFSVTAAVDLAYISFALHGCGIFGVLGYQLEHLFDHFLDSVGQKGVRKVRSNFLRELRRCIKHHNEILEYIRTFNSCYTNSQLVQIILITLLLSGLLVHVVNVLTETQNINELIVRIVHVSGLFGVVFLNVLPAQMLLNSSEEMFYKIYFAHWYMAPALDRKSVVIIQQNTMKPCSLKVGNFLTGPFKIFTSVRDITLVQTSLSYFTVLCSLKEQSITRS